MIAIRRPIFGRLPDSSSGLARSASRLDLDGYQRSPSLSLWPVCFDAATPSRPSLRHHPPVCASPAGAKTSFNTQ